MSVGCTLRGVWEEVRDATITLLGGVTFADLAARADGPWRDSSLLPARPVRAE
jgi:DNA-binding IscR family transcriptional regulator